MRDFGTEFNKLLNVDKNVQQAREFLRMNISSIEFSKHIESIVRNLFYNDDFSDDECLELIEMFLNRHGPTFITSSLIRCVCDGKRRYANILTTLLIHANRAIFDEELLNYIIYQTVRENLPLTGIRVLIDETQENIPTRALVINSMKTIIGNFFEVTENSVRSRGYCNTRVTELFNNTLILIPEVRKYILSMIRTDVDTFRINYPQIYDKLKDEL